MQFGQLPSDQQIKATIATLLEWVLAAEEGRKDLGLILGADANTG